MNISNVSAEKNIISILLKNIDNITTCSAENLNSPEFVIVSNQCIYSCICWLAEQGTKKVDAPLLLSTIKNKEALQEIEELGGLDYLVTLQNAPVLQENLKIYIKQVKDCSLKRMIYNLGINMQEEACTEKDVSELITEAQKKILQIGMQGGDKQVIKMGDNTLERLKERAEHPQEVLGYQLGWKEFDIKTQGFQGNDLVVIVAPSKTGKSAMLQNFTKILSTDGELVGLYIDTEMKSEEQEDRILSIISKIPLQEIRNGMFAMDTPYGKSKDKIERLNNAVVKLKNSAIYHVYMPDFDVQKVTSLIRQYKIQYDIDYCIFDYIKLPTSDVNSLNSAQEYQRLGYFTTCLKDMAGICDIPILTACQSNRSDLDNTDPDASCIGGSYRILQLATKLFFLRNKTPAELSEQGYAEGNQVLHLKYQRNGEPDSKINIMFERPILSMKEV